MIPTPENIKKLAKKKLEVHKKISNSFIENAITNSNLSVLKILYYLASILKKDDGINKQNKYKTYVLNLKDMLKYTELKATDIRNNIKIMQQTSITFIDEKNNIESGISLLPEYNFFWNKNKVEIDLNEKIARLIIEVTDKYTFISTKDLMKLKNKHSIRLLPLLHKVNGYDIKKKTMIISELNAFFGTNYKRLLELERSVLLKAKAELDNNSKLTFNYEINYDNIGQGRPKATSVTIVPVVKNNYQSTIFSNFEATPESQETITQTINPQEKQKTIFEAPTDDEVSFALIECNLEPAEATVKFEQFIEWKKGKKGKKSFKKFLVDGIKNGW